jgi:glycosyltransferase involved in cell wall biosynthesis
VSAGRGDSALSVLAAPAYYRLDPAFGSEGSWAVELVQRIAARGHRVHAITGQSSIEGNERLRIDEVGSLGQDLSLARRLGFVLRYSSAGFREVRGDDVDVLHHILPFSIGGTFNPLALLGRKDLPFVLGPVQVLDVIDPSLDNSDELGVEARVFDGEVRRSGLDHLLQLGTRIPRHLSLMTLRRADVVIATSETARRNCAAVVGSDRVLKVPPGVDTSAFSPPSHEARRDLLAVGYLVRRKRVDLVLGALAKLKSAGLTPTLRVIGDGPEKTSLQEMVRRLGIGDQVSFEGFVANDQLPEHYRRALALCQPSNAECAPMAPLEALACGAPAIASNVGLIGDLVRSDDVGLLVEPNIESVAAAIRTIVEDASRRHRMSVSAAKLVKAQFDWDIVVGRYLDAYAEAIDRRRGQSGSGRPRARRR